VDAGIRDTVTALRLLGFRTTASCEGHVDHGRPGPWVDVAFGKVTGHRLTRLLAEFAEEHRPEEPAAELTLTELLDPDGSRIVVLRLWSRATRDVAGDGERHAVLRIAAAEMVELTRFVRARLEAAVPQPGTPGARRR
jgi:hypothetical protein